MEPTAEDSRRASEITGPCYCDPAYKDRGLAQPDCFACQLGDDIARALAEQRERDVTRLEGRAKELRKYRLARNTYAPAIAHELEAQAAAIRRGEG